MRLNFTVDFSCISYLLFLIFCYQAERINSGARHKALNQINLTNAVVTLRSSILMAKAILDGSQEVSGIRLNDC